MATPSLQSKSVCATGDRAELWSWRVAGLRRAQQAYALAEAAMPQGECGSRECESREIVLDALDDRVHQAQWAVLECEAPDGAALLEKLEVLASKDLATTEEAWKIALADARRILGEA